MRSAVARVADHGQARKPLASQVIGRAATLALHDELALSPKPGLVTLVDAGSHDDMYARTFMRCLFALRGYFVLRIEWPHGVLQRHRDAAGRKSATGRVSITLK